LYHRKANQAIIPEIIFGGDLQMFDLSGKVAVITGSTRGIGKAIAEQMALHGAKVVVSSRNAPACEAVSKEINDRIRDGNGEAAPIPCNISHKDQMQDLVSRTLERFGHIDIVVCNAAVNAHYGPLIDISEKEFDKTMNSNVKSTLWLCRMVLPGMVEREEGVIIVISSISAFRGTNVIGAYGISKAAEIALVRNIAFEYGPKNIRANAIAPGLIKTNFSRALWQDQKFLNNRLSITPLRRIGRPEEIAGAAVFLASDAGSFMTGQTLIIDGGVMARVTASPAIPSAVVKILLFVISEFMASQ
jgi:NAD(P)-dependent dehydrogenase (short-subunit alcohol dehydrogenase family)